MAEGRRERMRNKIRSRGIDGLPPHEIIEFLLYPFVPRKDTSPLARTLLYEFGGLDNLLKASEEELLSIPGMPKNAALTFPLYKPLVDGANRLNSLNKQKGVKDADQIGKYCLKLLENCYNERIIAIYVNENEKILGQKVISDGTTARAKIDFNKIAKGAILLDAKGVVIAHNHPGGGLFASLDDIEVTDRLEEHLSNIGIRLLDHIIVGDKEVISILRSKKDE